MTRAARAGWGGLSVAALLVASVGSGAAQTRAMGAAATHSAPVRAGSTRTGKFVATPLQPNYAPIGSGPGLNFGYVPGTTWSSRQGGRASTPYVWFYSGSYPYAGYAADAQPPYDDPQPPDAGAQGEQYAPADSYESSSASAEPEAPAPEVGQFILVRLDGQVILAVAFTAVNGRVTYISSDGTRRSFPLVDLDRQATVQMNDANGTSVSLPE